MSSPFLSLETPIMKIQIALFIALLTTQQSFAQQTNISDAAKVGYSFGYFMGRNYAEPLKEIDLDSFTAGLKSAVKGEKSALTDEEMARVLLQFKRQNEAKELLDLKQKADLNAKLGEDFLKQNAKKSNIKTTASGLQYLVIKKGNKKSPTKNSTVQVHYEGRLIDGTVFDSSIAREQPAEFRLNQVIQGWTEGLQLMQEGAQYRFFIPSALAYGQIGSGDVIEPNSTLIFDVELLKIINP